MIHRTEIGISLLLLLPDDHLPPLLQPPASHLLRTMVQSMRNKTNIPQYYSLVKSEPSLFLLGSIIIFADWTTVIYFRPGSHTYIMKGMHAWQKSN